MNAALIFVPITKSNMLIVGEHEPSCDRLTLLITRISTENLCFFLELVRVFLQKRLAGVLLHFLHFSPVKTIFGDTDQTLIGHKISFISKTLRALVQKLQMDKCVQTNVSSHTCAVSVPVTALHPGGTPFLSAPPLF